MSAQDPRAMMGFTSPGDRTVAMPVRTWGGIKLALWRSRWGWEITMRTALELVANCAHVDGCPGETFETEPCLPECPDRERRMSALVILNAARMFAPVAANKPANEPYFAPSREHFSEIVAELAITQAKLEAVLMLVPQPPPPPNAEPATLPKQVPFRLPEPEPEAPLDD